MFYYFEACLNASENTERDRNRGMLHLKYLATPKQNNKEFKYKNI